MGKKFLAFSFIALICLFLPACDEEEPDLPYSVEGTVYLLDSFPRTDHSFFNSTVRIFAGPNTYDGDVANNGSYEVKYDCPDNVDTAYIITVCIDRRDLSVHESNETDFPCGEFSNIDQYAYKK